MLNLSNINGYDLSIVGEKIRYERELLGYTQEKLAEQLDIIASKSKNYNNKQKSRQTIANWEKGETYPSYQDMVNLCNLLPKRKNPQQNKRKYRYTKGNTLDGRNYQ